MAIDSIFLVLSDLHFGRDFHLPPELPPLQLTRAARWLGKDKDLEQFVQRNCRGHSVACVGALAYALASVLQDARREGYVDGDHEDEFDLCILLGDQATVPDAQSYRFLCQYLTEARYETVFQLGCEGLSLAPDRILAVPGNHDKLLRRNLDIYHQELTDTLGVPRVNPGEAFLVSKSIGNQEFLFALVDGNVYAAEELVIDLGCRDHLAQGKITPELDAELRGKLGALMQGRVVDDATLHGSYEDAIKIVLVHYAIDIARLPGHKGWSEKVLPHACKNLDYLVDRLKVEFGFTLALHGHMHVPDLHNQKGVQVISATTTTEQRGPNGFFVLKLLDTGEIRAEHHCWTGRMFTVDPDRSLTRQLEVYPRRGVA